MNILKDIISLLGYLFITPFCASKDAVLVYHSVGEIDREDDPYKVNVKPELFARHVEYLFKRRRPNYILTFDDGFENLYTCAFPVLKKYRFRVILFLTTDFIDKRMKLDNFFGDRYSPNPLTWDQIKEMASSGIEIGSHTLTHRNMAALDDAAMGKEALDSRKRIEDITGCRVEAFSYPFGSRGTFNDRTTELLKAFSYRAAYTNIMGMDNSKREPFKIKRIRIYGDDNIFRFRMKIAGAYNWVDRFANIFSR